MSETVTAMEVQEEQMQEKVSPIVAEAEALVVDSQEVVEKGTEVVKGIKALVKEVNETFDPIIKQAHKAHKEAVGTKKRHLEPLDKAEQTIKAKIAQYLDHVEEEQRKEEERAREQARKEHEKKLKAAERKVTRLTEKAGTIQEEIDALEAGLEKETLDEEGVEEQAIRARIATLRKRLDNTSEAIEEHATEAEAPSFTPPAPPTTPPARKVAGMSSRKKTVVNVVNPTLLIRAVADGKVPVSVVKFDETAIRKLVDAGMKLPGVAARHKRSVSVRG